jgi:hypothetical protein
MKKISFNFGKKENDYDLLHIPSQNARIMKGEAHHLMGEPREMRFDLVDRSGFVIYTPVMEGETIMFFEKNTPGERVAPYTPVGKFNYMTQTEEGIVPMELDDPLLEDYKEYVSPREPAEIKRFVES